MTADVLSGPAGPAVTGRPEATPSRWHWRNWPVVVKLGAVLLVPTIVALVAGVLRIVDQAGAAPGYARISQIVGVQQQLSDLIGAVARERGLATAYVATGRTGDRQPLESQFGVVDSSVQVVTDATSQLGNLDITSSGLAALSALGPLRASVTNGFGPVEVVVTEYNAVIDPLVELDSALIRQLDDVAVTNDAAAVHALVAVREQVSRQHAIVSAALYANRISPTQLDDLRTATVRLATEQDAFRGALPPAERASAAALLGGDAELARQRLLRLVLTRGLAGEPLNTSPQDWDQRNAVVVDSVATAEKELRQRIDRTAQELLAQVRTAAGANSVILFFALALGVLIGILVTRALLRPLGVLKRTALDVADRRLPEAMARIRDGDVPKDAIDPVPVGTREEIGQVARAFDEVHSQAVRLASEQAQLRANVNDIFVNLSRRTQGLVERQLKLIDRLESGEQDPKQLDNLFQLDHLATRMRRNSENLLVLAGTDATNRTGRPVRLVDVLRAAVSEVEQYQRLVLQQPPAVLVLGRVANDLVHLLAELLDNATQFSPPDSKVMISSDFATGGSVVIEVADRGVGMTDTELVESNERLAKPPVVDASVSRRMGLFVVGRLAGRHGIDVRLRRAEGGVGICACVTVPSRLVRVASETVEPRATAVSAPVTGNGSISSEVAASVVSSADRNGVPVPRPRNDPKRDPKIDPKIDSDSGPDADTADRHESNGNSAQSSAGQPAPNDPAGDSRPPSTGKPSQGTGERSTPTGPPPAPPGPPVSPLADVPKDAPSTGSEPDLFQPKRASVAGPVGPGHRATLQHSTPIFDDVASAWFKEHDAVPVGWTAPSAGVPAGSTRDASPQETPAPNAGTAQDPTTDDGPAKAATTGATAGRPPLVRRQPGKALAGSGSGDAGKPRPADDWAPAVGSTRSSGAPAQDWGAADEGWRAAEALATPVSAEFTAIGLPRRQPRALLVPGAAGGTEPQAAPARSAESIRGRLASYQQGIREGRQARRNLYQEAHGSPSGQEDAEEETK
ncbi:MAG: nitrate- and nitrite sensing domain-containing protein [Actinomycetota bacterium]|nr:nitrate- and nitrite sensing domain-containing protein [Actinomycetota bacterium]